MAPPSLTMVSHVTGRAVEPDETLDAAYWRRQASERETSTVARRRWRTWEWRPW